MEETYISHDFSVWRESFLAEFTGEAMAKIDNWLDRIQSDLQIYNKAFLALNHVDDLESHNFKQLRRKLEERGYRVSFPSGFTPPTVWVDIENPIWTIRNVYENTLENFTQESSIDPLARKAGKAFFGTGSVKAMSLDSPHLKSTLVLGTSNTERVLFHIVGEPPILLFKTDENNFYLDGRQWHLDQSFLTELRPGRLVP